MRRSAADAFLEAILQNPDDDTPRLIYADWLDEQGNAANSARAEFIRVQCALAGPLPPERRADLMRREQQLLDEWDEEWVRPLRRLMRTWMFHRGFIDEVAVWSDAFLACADELFRQAPIQHLRLWPQPLAQRLNMAELADSEHLQHLLSLDLTDNRLESRHVRALLVSNHLTTLTSLRLAYNRIGDSGIRALAEAPLLGQLMHLDLRSNDIGPRGIRALSRALLQMDCSPDGLRMRVVELQHNNLGAAGQRVVADSPLLRRVMRC